MDAEDPGPSTATHIGPSEALGTGPGKEGAVGEEVGQLSFPAHTKTNIQEKLFSETKIQQMEKTSEV
jgi:hypothetical protein